MDELVKQLNTPSPVLCARPEKSGQALQECIDRNHVHILFKETGTELSVPLYRPECQLPGAINKTTARLVGAVTLNYQKVKCVADINLTTCEGVGYLLPLEASEYKRIKA